MKKLLILTLLIVTNITFGQITQQDYEHYKNSIQGRFSSYPQTLVDTTKSDVLIRTKYLYQKNGYDYFYTQQGEWFKETFYPYRQRIYKTKNEGTHILLEIHTINVPYTILTDTPKQHPTFQMDTSLLDNPNILIEKKPGCDIHIVKVWEKDGTPILYGSTNENDCVATFNGSTYTQVNFLILPNSLISWERGYNDKNEQVWGPKESPYLFMKVSKD